MRYRVLPTALFLLALVGSPLPALSASISGRVFEEINGNGVPDPGEPSADCVVSLRWARGEP